MRCHKKNDSYIYVIATKIGISISATIGSGHRCMRRRGINNVWNRWFYRKPTGSTDLVGRSVYCLAVQFAKVRGKITEEQYSYYISELLTLPEKMQKALEDKERIQWFAAKYANAHDVFFVGRGIDYAVCLEGSLKLKEISYIHSEAYAAGELKHGTISLIEQGTLVIGVLTQSELYEKTISNMLECKSRGAYLMGLTTYGKYEIEDQVNFTVYVPKVDEHFVGSLAVIPLQLLGYYVSVAKGLDVDKPRNLAKSVTVE